MKILRVQNLFNKLDIEYKVFVALQFIPSSKNLLKLKAITPLGETRQTRKT